MRISPWLCVRERGRGGNATVWRARRDDDEREVALKVVNSTKARAEPYRRFVQEIGFVRGLRDFPGVLPLDADARIAQHLAGARSPLVRAAVLAGSRVRVAATFVGSRYLERRLKRWHNTTARVCPICRVRRAAGAAAGPPDDGVCQVPGTTVRDRL